MVLYLPNIKIKTMDEGKELLETNLERVEGLEDVNPLHHSEHST